MTEQAQFHGSGHREEFLDGCNNIAKDIQSRTIYGMIPNTLVLSFNFKLVSLSFELTFRAVLYVQSFSTDMCALFYHLLLPINLGVVQQANHQPPHHLR